MKKGTKDTIQWHPAFQASIQIEFEAEAEKLTFEPEHLLSKKPMQMDELIIKVAENEVIHKNIGRIFKRYNIIEYKSPDDNLTINDFYKVYGYCCFYQSDTDKVCEIPPQELTITFICNHFPQKDDSASKGLSRIGHCSYRCRNLLYNRGCFSNTTSRNKRVGSKRKSLVAEFT